MFSRAESVLENILCFYTVIFGVDQTRYLISPDRKSRLIYLLSRYRPLGWTAPQSIHGCRICWPHAVNFFTKKRANNRWPFLFATYGLTQASYQSQLNAPPVWYSITRVSKKFFSFFKSMISLIHGNGLVVPGYSSFRPICDRRRLAMNLR